MSAAIVVIDIQEDFFAKEYVDQAQDAAVKQRLMANINPLLNDARECRQPVFLS